MDEEIDLDPAALARLRRVGGDAFLSRMLDLFLEYAPDRIEAARGAFQAGNLRGVEEAVHSLKSSAGNVGASVIQRLAETVEGLAADSATDRIGGLLQDLHLAFQRIEPLIRREMRGTQS